MPFDAGSSAKPFAGQPGLACGLHDLADKTLGPASTLIAVFDTTWPDTEIIVTRNHRRFAYI
jgi:hypothetical protein